MTHNLNCDYFVQETTNSFYIKNIVTNISRYKEMLVIACFVLLFASVDCSNIDYKLNIDSVVVTIGWSMQQGIQQKQIGGVGGYIIVLSKVSSASSHVNPGYVKLIGSDWYQYTYGEFESGMTYYGEIEVTDKDFLSSKVLGQFYITMPNLTTVTLPQRDSVAHKVLPTASGVRLDSFTATISWIPAVNHSDFLGYYIEINQVEATGKLSLPFQHIKVGNGSISSCKVYGLKPGFVYQVSLRGVLPYEMMTDVLAVGSIHGGLFTEVKESQAPPEETESFQHENRLASEEQVADGKESQVLPEERGSFPIKNRLASEEQVVDDDPYVSMKKKNVLTCYTYSAGASYDGFPCSEENVCIPLLWVCDGENDCAGGEDEMKCGPAPLPVSDSCREDQFACKNHDETKRCISLSWLCDEDVDCADGSDEDPRNCPVALPRPCAKDQFRCPEPDGSCIPGKRLCDGARDCYDGADEDRCSTGPCNLETEFSCMSVTDGVTHPVRCIPVTWVCDGDLDCPNGDDEYISTCVSGNGKKIGVDNNHLQYT